MEKHIPVITDSRARVGKNTDFQQGDVHHSKIILLKIAPECSRASECISLKISKKLELLSPI